MLNINSLKFVTANNPHNFVKNTRKLIPYSRKPRPVDTRHSWLDKYGNIFSYEEKRPDILGIIIRDRCQPTITDYINLLTKDIKVVVIHVNYSEENTNILNSILGVLSIKNTNRNIIVNTENSIFRITDDVNYRNLPSNVKFGNINSDMTTNFYGENSFDWWSLHLNDAAFEILKRKSISPTRQRLIDLRVASKNLYNDLKKDYPNLDRMSNLEKANLVYDILSRNIGYDFSSTTTNAQGVRVPRGDRLESSDPIETLKEKKGVCTGRSRALKLLLNNRYMKVPCFLTDGYRKSGEGHEWVEVYEDNQRYYYDLSFGIKGNPITDSIRIKHKDFELQGFEAIEKIERKDPQSKGYQKRR